MRAMIRKWGNGAAVRLPASVLADAGLAVGSAVDMRVKDGRVVVKCVGPARLDGLLTAITPENLHGETDFGGPQGGEAS